MAADFKSINFVTIQKTPKTTYEVVQVKFPEKPNLLKASVTVINTLENQETAEAAANQFALLKNYYYVPYNQNIITSFPFQNRFLAFEVNAKGNITGRGFVTNEAESKIEAIEEASKRNLKFIPFPK